MLHADGPPSVSLMPDANKLFTSFIFIDIFILLDLCCEYLSMFAIFIPFIPFLDLLDFSWISLSLCMFYIIFHV